MTYIRREYPEKSWSMSRRSLLDECARKYYYHYYGAHNGWERSASELAKDAYRLKKLTNIYLVLGDALHEVAAEGLRRVRSGERMPNAATMEKEVRDKLNHVFLSSKNNRQQFIERPARNPMFHEVYYGYGLSDHRIKEINDRLSVCIPNLLSSKSFLEATSPTVSHISKVDQLDSFEWLATKVYAVPDLLYKLHVKDEGDRWVIVDWKTGAESDEHMEQVKVYALYAKEKLGIPPEDIVIRVEYLLTGNYMEALVTPDDLLQTDVLIKESMARMDSLLEDPEQNRPRSMDAFPLKDDTRLCSYCNFYALCREEIESTA